MEPGQDTVLPEVAATAETAYAMPAGVETTPIAEVVPQSPAQPTPIIPAQAGIQTVDPASSIPTQADNVVAPEEVKDLTDSTIESADRDWVGKVRDVMRDDNGKPFKEEEDAEDLNEAYMKSRFNVDVDAPIEEK